MTLNMTGLGQGRPPPRKRRGLISQSSSGWSQNTSCHCKSQIVWWRLPISVPKFDHDNDNAKTDDEDEDGDVYRCNDDNEYDNDNDDLIFEDDWKKFSFLTIDEIHELRNTERELIFQSLKKIVHDDHLSQKVGGEYTGRHF